MVWLILSSQSCTCDLLTEIVRSHTIVNAEFALFAASGAVCPRLAAEHAFGESGNCRFAAGNCCGGAGASRDRFV